MILPAKSEAVIPSKVVYSNLHRPPPSLCVTDNKECRPGVKTARCLLNVGEGTNLPLRVLNINNEAVTLPAGTFLCPLREVEAVLVRKSPKERSIVVHVDEHKKCTSLNEANPINCVQCLCVPVVKEMPKRKTTKDEGAEEKKEAICPECKKVFQRPTDGNRHYEMKHLQIKRECRHCGSILGSVSALHRHLEVQHQIKLSTRPGILAPDQWKMIPVGEDAPPGGRGRSTDSPVQQHSEVTVRSVRTEPVASEGSSSVRLEREAPTPRRPAPARRSVVVGFDTEGGYASQENVRFGDLESPDVELDRIKLPTDIEVQEGKKQLREWRKEHIAAPRPIAREFWLSRWRKQSPKLGFATRLAAEAMLDMAVDMQRAARIEPGPASTVVSRPGAVTARIRVCTDLPQRQRSKSYLRRLPGRLAASAAAGSAATIPPEPTSRATEDMETATMCFTALTTTDTSVEKVVTSAGSDVMMGDQHPDTDEWESVTLTQETTEEQFFVFSEEDVVASCEGDL